MIQKTANEETVDSSIMYQLQPTLRENIRHLNAFQNVLSNEINPNEMFRLRSQLIGSIYGMAKNGVLYLTTNRAGEVFATTMAEEGQLWTFNRKDSSIRSTYTERAALRVEQNLENSSTVQELDCLTTREYDEVISKDADLTSGPKKIQPRLGTYLILTKGG